MSRKQWNECCQLIPVKFLLSDGCHSSDLQSGYRGENFGERLYTLLFILRQTSENTQWKPNYFSTLRDFRQREKNLSLYHYVCSSHDSLVYVTGFVSGQGLPTRHYSSKLLG